MPQRARLEELWRKVDAFFERVDSRLPGEMACAAGCADCCRRRLSVTGLEAEVILEELTRLPPDERARLAERAAAGGEACAALGEDGRCGIYASRPLVCRSHGLPIRFEAEAPGRRSLPVVDACPKNFIGRDLAAVDPACVLDQRTLSTILAALDAAHADASGRDRGERFDLAALLAEAG